MLKVANSVISASRITGVLPVVNGGTGVTTSTGTGNTVLSASPTLSGDVNFSTGNLVIGTAGKGIDFSITSSGSGTMTSELLADYEEGAWTPAISYSTSNGNLSQSIQAGRYVKVGQQVTVVGYVLFGETTASGDISVTGLPFVMQNTSGLNGGFGVYIDNMSLVVGGVTGMLPANDSAFLLVYSGTGVQTALSNSNTGTNNNVVRFCFSYITN